MQKPMKTEQLPLRAPGLSFSLRRGAPIWTHIRVESRGQELGSNYQLMSTKEFVAICELLNETWHILAFQKFQLTPEIITASLDLGTG